MRPNFCRALLEALALAAYTAIRLARSPDWNAPVVLILLCEALAPHQAVAAGEAAALLYLLPPLGQRHWGRHPALSPGDGPLLKQERREGG